MGIRVALFSRMEFSEMEVITDSATGTGNLYDDAQPEVIFCPVYRTAMVSKMLRCASRV